MAIFLANYFVVRRFLIRPVNEILMARERDVRDADRRYEEAVSGFHEATKKMETKVQEARREASEIRERFRGEAAHHRGEVLERTRGESEQLTREAEAIVEKEMAAGKARIQTEADGLARLAAERILGRRLA